ncbi:glycosyltransferase family 2 protein [Streptomyces sp. SP17BM10]|uniref:glycosyltransferase family 2 protein n=1 Tax=Streptomyces sp. SP17BM10 TaxID=3002530 RepID=UPI002E7901B0|nr:glycosyltransferase family 2 protein [Streptomyces sp. SP17BM10]
MPDVLHDWMVLRQDTIVRFAGLISLLLVAYMVLVFGRFLVYWAGSRHAFRRNRPAEPGDPTAFRWHLVIPCRDEEAVVAQTLAGLRACAPEAHLWVIDDDSEDATRELVLAAAAHDDRVHLVQRRRPHARIGKGAALNAAYREISAWLPADADRSRVVIGVVDADGRLGAGTLAQVCGDKALGRPDTGAVQIGVRMRNADDELPLPGRGRAANAFARALVRMQDVEFQANNAGMQLLRRRTGSVGLGGNGQFVRLTALDSLTAEEGRAGRPWSERALLEDYESGLDLRLAGWRLTHVTEARVSQEALVSPRRFLTQRTRWAQGNMQCLRYTGRVLRSPHYTWSGKAEVMYTFLQPVACVLLVLLTPLSIAITAAGLVLFPAETADFQLRFGPYMAVAFVVATLPMVFWGFTYRTLVHPDRRRLTGLLWGVLVWIYAYHLFVVATRAAVRMLLGRNGWAKTRRNAEKVAVGAPTAVES